MSALFNEILYRPLLNGLVWLYQVVAFEDLGVAIILLTVLIRVILFPLFHKTVKHQRLTQELQPHIKKIQEDHKDNREAQTKAILDLYSSHKVNPFTPFLLLLIQLPILFALYKVFVTGFTEESFTFLYPFISAPTTINHYFLGVVNLQETNFVIVGVATIAQYFQGTLAMPKREKGYVLTQAESVGRNMIYIAPAMTLLILFNFPAALGLYWLTTTAFSIIQQIFVNRLFDHGTATKST